MFNYSPNKMNIQLLTSLANRIFPTDLTQKYGKVPKYVVTVIGGGGTIGSGISSFLKNNNSIKELRIYDFIDPTEFTSKLNESHPLMKVTSFYPTEINKAMDGSHLILVPAGIPRDKNTDRDHLFHVNGRIIGHVLLQAAIHAPEAILLLMTNPLTSIYPMAVEILKRAKVFDPNKLIGVTTHDSYRANLFLSNLLNGTPKEFTVPCIGGSSNNTIIPLYSQCHVCGDYTKKHPKMNISNLTGDQRDELVEKVQNENDDDLVPGSGMEFPGNIVDSLAYTNFTVNLIRSLDGEQNIRLYGYLPSDLGHADFLVSPFEYRRDRTIKRLPFDKMDEYETNLFQSMLPSLNGQIQKGLELGRTFNKDVKF